MSRFVQLTLLAFFCLFAAPCHAAANGPDQSKQYLEDLMSVVCGISSCSETLYAANPADAEKIIQNGVYLVMDSQYAQLEKFNAPLKAMGIENAMIVPPRMVEDAICKYYGYSIAKNPELQKVAEEQAKYGFFIANMGDAGETGYNIKKVETLKNGLLRATGTALDDEPFRAYFARSNCGGKPHWVLLRVVHDIPQEEEEYFQIQMQ